MKLKFDEKGNVVVKDGMPVYLHDDGKEIAFDAPGAIAKISTLNGEAMGHRQNAEALAAKLKPYETITDPAAALKAIETLKNIDQSKLVDAGKVEQVKAEAIKATQEQFAGIQKSLTDEISSLKQTNQTLQSNYAAEKIGGHFSNSPYIPEKLVIPPDLVQAKFGHHFKIEDGRVVGYGADGKQIFSRARPGDLAEFNEALEILVDKYPYKDSILKGQVRDGGGAANQNPGAGGKKTIKRSDFDALPVAQKRELMKAGSGTTVVD